MTRSEIIVLFSIVLFFLFIALMLTIDWETPDVMRKALWFWIASSYSMFIMGLCYENIPVPRMALAAVSTAVILTLMGKSFSCLLPGKEDGKTRKEGC